MTQKADASMRKRDLDAKLKANEAGKSPVRGQTGRKLSDTEVVRVKNNIKCFTDDRIGTIQRARLEVAVLHPVFFVESPKEQWYQTAVVCASVALLLHILLFLNLLLGSTTASIFLGPVACCAVLVCAFGFWFVAFLLMFFLQ